MTKDKMEIDMTDIALYKLHRTFQDFSTNKWGFFPSSLNLAFLVGEEVPGMHEISVNRWLFEVRTIQQSYAEHLV